jgi:glycosyltransferase involved in cell wall biosynthesis
MDYFANVEAVLFFIHEILPLIQNKVPEVKFFVVGSNPSPEISILPKSHPNVVVTGHVESVRPFVVNSAVFVAPMRIARGVQNKILEAMSMGVPVVTTSLGFEGISAKAGQDIFVEDNPDLFANRVVKLLLDNALRHEISRKSIMTVKKYYNWSSNLVILDKVLNLIARKN